MKTTHDAPPPIGITLNKKIPFLRGLLVGCGFLLTVLLYIDRAAISVAKKDISHDLGFSTTEFGWIMAMFTLGYALLQPASGKWVDQKGARRVVAIIVAIWSLLTSMTGLAWNFTSMLVIRFLFGAGEAGALPALSKVVLNWFPISERGLVQGIHFSGSRLGAAFGIPAVAVLIEALGWRATFFALGGVGVLFSILWFAYFRDRPEETGCITNAERNYIIENRQAVSISSTAAPLPFFHIIRAQVMQLTMLQYICSNFTFYFTLTWMFPFVQQKFQLSAVNAGLYSTVPLIAGFFGNIVSGLLVDALYRRNGAALSRRIPAMLGFSLAAFGMIMVTLATHPLTAVAFLAVAVFGADMTLSPSWAFCIDIGKEHAGKVSGTMNMAGNLGAFCMIIAYPYLHEWSGSHLPFFYLASGLSIVGMMTWMLMNPDSRFIESRH